MKRFLPLIAIAIAAYVAFAPRHSLPTAVSASPVANSAQGNSTLATAIAAHAHNVRVEGVGRVSKVLPDDNEGSRHQRLLVRLESGQTILIAHNIDLAPRVDAFGEGDVVEFSGEYEWNPRGGMVHWTHRDPAERHAAGWLRHNGQTYQ